MLKNAIILFLFQILALNTWGQRDNNKEKEEFVIPNNKPGMNEALEEIKQKISESESKLKSYKYFSQSLETYKKRVERFEPNNIESYIEDIRVELTKKDFEAIYSDEESISSELGKLEFYFRSLLNSSDYYDITSNSDFQKKLDALLNPITEINLLKIIISNHDNLNKAAITDMEKLNLIKTKLSTQTLSTIKNNILSLIDEEVKKQLKNIQEIETQIKEIRANKNKLTQKLNEEETQINDLAIKLGLPLFCATILFLFLGTSILSKDKKNDPRSVPNNLPSTSQNVLVEISTVLLLTMTILILGLSGKVNGDVLGTLIGGISGYVLNRIKTSVSEAR